MFHTVPENVPAKALRLQDNSGAEQMGQWNMM
jgi:hypothetical protein